MNFKFWLFLKVSEIVAKVGFVKSRYLDPHTSDFDPKYLISTEIAQEKISESFIYVALTIYKIRPFLLGGALRAPPIQRYLKKAHTS